MDFSRIVFLSLRFLYAKKWQYFLVFLGVFLGTSLFFIFMSVTNGLNISLTETFAQKKEIISVQKNPKNDIELTDILIQELESLNEIEKVYRETAMVIPFTFDIKIPFANNFSLDLYFIYGMEDELFNSYKGHQEQKGDVPILINPLSVDIINSFVQSLVGNISISNDLFSKKLVSAELGTSTFIPAMNRDKKIEKKLLVSGFSSFAPLVGVSLPLSEVRKIQQFFGEDSTKYSRLHIEKKPQYSHSTVKKILEEEGLLIRSNNAISDKISEITEILQWVLLFSSSVILFLSFLFLFSVLHIVLVEHKKTIGILQAMGMDNKQISLLFIIQGAGVSLLATIFGVGVGIGLLQILQEWWRGAVNLFLFPPEIFTYTFSSIGFIFCISSVATFLTLFFIIRRQINTPVLHNILQID